MRHLGGGEEYDLDSEARLQRDEDALLVQGLRGATDKAQRKGVHGRLVTPHDTLDNVRVRVAPGRVNPGRSAKASPG